MELIAITSDLLAQTKKTWMDSLNGAHELFVTEYQQLFDLIEESGGVGDLGNRCNKPIYYGVIDDKNYVWALVEIVQSRKGSSVWIKMMDMFLSPQLEILPDNENTTSKRLEIFTSALVGIFMLTKTIHGADTVKVYGRTEALVSFLKGMHDSFSVIASLGTIKGVSVQIEGRWLVFRSAEI